MAPSMTGVSGDTMDARRGKVSGNLHDKDDSEPLREGRREGAATKCVPPR